MSGLCYQFISIFLGLGLLISCSGNKERKEQINLPLTHEQNVIDTLHIVSFPVLGKWMYQSDTQRAHWLGAKWEGKNLIEPVNIILIDSVSVTAEEAEENLIEKLSQAGYTSRSQHSSGYMAYIGSAFYKQLPREKDHAFSNHVAELDNNHARIFGPYKETGRFLFTAALSRENVAPFNKVKHSYASFNRARDEFSQSLNEKGDYKIAFFVNMKNTILNDTVNTTGDHDGEAVVLVLSIK